MAAVEEEESALDDFAALWDSFAFNLFRAQFFNSGPVDGGQARRKRGRPYKFQGLRCVSRLFETDVRVGKGTTALLALWGSGGGRSG